MNDEFKRILDRGEKIIAEAPPYATDNDKIKMLSLRFRLDKSDGKNILKFLKNLK